jgi:ribosomal protein S27AE
MEMQHVLQEFYYFASFRVLQCLTSLDSLRTFTVEVIMQRRTQMPRWKLKDCPRCGGDIFMDIEENGWLGHCLQCGYMGRHADSVPETPMSISQDVMRSATAHSIRQELFQDRSRA